MPSNHLILSSPSPPALNLSQHQGLCSNTCPLCQWFYLTISSSALPSFASMFPRIRVFSRVGSLHQVARVLELQHQSFQRILRIDFLRSDCVDSLAVQGTLKSLLQHHNSKASVLRHSAFCLVQLSHLNVTTGKTIALTIWTFAGKVMFLLFNTLSSSQLSFQGTSIFNFHGCAVTVGSDFGAQENTICHCFHFPPFYLP